MQKSISDAETKISQLESAIKEMAGNLLQLKADVKQHAADRAAAKEAIAEATAIREKEAAIFAKASSDFKTNIAAMTKAIAALEKGVSGFLHTNVASFASLCRVTTFRMKTEMISQHFCPELPTMVMHLRVLILSRNCQLRKATNLCLT